MVNSALWAFMIVIAFVAKVHGHSSIFTEAMLGLNVTQNDKRFSRDNRPVAPLFNLTFEEWWFHDHLSIPPPKDTVFELPAGGNAPIEIACEQSATSLFNDIVGGDTQDGNNPCPGLPTTAFHASNESDAAGCGFGIAYKDNVTDVQPEDFVIFSTIRTCVWTRFNQIAVPAKMPACPNGMCICAFFWQHNFGGKDGSEQIYMNGFQCNVTNSTSNVPVAQGKVPRFCGASVQHGSAEAHPSNCTYGAMNPFYWQQQERNNYFSDVTQPPLYNELFNFVDGAQNNIFEDSMLPVFENDTIVSYTMQGTVPGATATAIPASVYSSSIAAQATKSASVSSSSSGTKVKGKTSSSAGIPVPTGVAGNDSSSRVCRRKRSNIPGETTDLRRELRKHRSNAFQRVKDKLF